MPLDHHVGGGGNRSTPVPHGEPKNEPPFTNPASANGQGKTPVKKRPVVVPGKTLRERMAKLMDATVMNEPNWHYHAVRPLSYPTLTQAEHAAVASDCSFGCAILALLAGAGKPFGRTFQGNSSTMFALLDHINQADVQIGDYAVFGHTNGEMHAVCIRQPGGDPLCWSHGQEKGPMFVKMSVEMAAHPGATVTYLRLPTK
jgi:hypothetical protein